MDEKLLIDLIDAADKTFCAAVRIDRSSMIVKGF